MANPYECSGGATLIFACSGAADVGEISDRAARKMTRDGVGTMFCLAGVGGGVAGIVQKTKAASRIVAIDGCPLDCTKKCLERAGITSFAYMRVTDLGLEKGGSPATDKNVAKVAETAWALLA